MVLATVVTGELSLLPTAQAQSDCQTAAEIESLNEGVLKNRIVHISEPKAIVFVLLDPFWSLSDFEVVPHRQDEDMANIRTRLKSILAQGADEVIAWAFRKPLGLGVAVLFKDGCAVPGYGEPDRIDKIIAMNRAYALVTEQGVDAPEVRESVAKVLRQTPYQPDDDKISAILAKVRPVLTAGKGR